MRDSVFAGRQRAQCGRWTNTIFMSSTRGPSGRSALLGPAPARVATCLPCTTGKTEIATSACVRRADSVARRPPARCPARSAPASLSRSPVHSPAHSPARSLIHAQPGGPLKTVDLRRELSQILDHVLRRDAPASASAVVAAAADDFRTYFPAVVVPSTEKDPELRGRFQPHFLFLEKLPQKFDTADGTGPFCPPPSLHACIHASVRPSARSSSLHPSLRSAQ